MLPTPEIESRHDLLDARLLIMDDQQGASLRLTQALREAGYAHLRTATDVRTATALHGELPFDLVLLDMQIPQRWGQQVWTDLQSLGNTPHSPLPILAITSQPGQHLAALRAGATDFIGKPFDPLELQTRIHNLLSVRLLQQRLQTAQAQLEQTVTHRTAELAASEARFRSLVRLSADWYWEQDAQGHFVETSGPVMEMLGLDDTLPSQTGQTAPATWHAGQRAALEGLIAARQPFLDQVYSRTWADGRVQTLQVSGEPILDSGCAFIGYRGVGSDITARLRKAD